MKAKCSNCKFWMYFDFDEDDEEDIGMCRRYPPVNVGLNLTHEARGWDYPTTRESGWCGEHKPDQPEGVAA